MTYGIVAEMLKLAYTSKLMQAPNSLRRMKVIGLPVFGPEEVKTELMLL